MSYRELKYIKECWCAGKKVKVTQEREALSCKVCKSTIPEVQKPAVKERKKEKTDN